MGMTLEILAFDVGDDIVGVLDLTSGSYEAFRGNRKVVGAKRLIDCRGAIVSFNGNRYDVPRLAWTRSRFRLDTTICAKSPQSVDGRQTPEQL